MNFIDEIGIAEEMDRNESITVNVGDYLDLVDMWMHFVQMVSLIEDGEFEKSGQVFSVLVEKASDFSIRKADELISEETN